MRVFLGRDAEKFLKGLPIAKSSIMYEKQLNKIKKFPVVLKLISPKAVHKTEIDGVKIVSDKEKLQKEFKNLINIAKKKKLRQFKILAQEYIKGREFIIGIKKDPTFGHVIMFGAGGIFVESLNDVTFRVCPINDNDAESMLSDLKNQWLISGIRGQKPLKSKQLKQILINISKLPQKHKKIEELDINPLIANERDMKISDVRIITN